MPKSYHVIHRPDGLKLVPVADDPLAALRDEFADVDATARELRSRGREAMLNEAGR